MSAGAQEKPKMPEVLSFNGQTYRISDHQELKDFVGEVTKHIAVTEKTKLYAQLESLREKLATLEVEAKTGVAIDYNKIQEMISTQLKEQLAVNETNIANKVHNLLAPVVESVKTQNTESLEQFKLKLLNDNKGQCMPELVVGDTKEELIATMEKSKKLYADYAGKPPVLPINETYANPNQQVTANPVVNTGNQTQTLSSNGATNNSVANTQPVQNTPIQTPSEMIVPPVNQVIDNAKFPDVRKMGTKEFAQKRESLEAELRAAMGG
jgi:hypothetical protein